MSIPETFTIRKISGKVGKEFIIEHHYSHGCHNGPMCWGLFREDNLIGVIAFATPGSENVRRSLFGRDHVNKVTELHRLVILDETPTNTESWFIGKALKELKALKPMLWGVVSFADSTEGHVGTIYQATNALYAEMTAPTRFYRDQSGRLRHPRQNGHNVTLAEAAEKGWVAEKRQAKHRYIFLLGSAREKKNHRKELLFEISDYPKGKS